MRLGSSRRWRQQGRCSGRLYAWGGMSRPDRCLQKKPSLGMDGFRNGPRGGSVHRAAVRAAERIGPMGSGSERSVPCPAAGDATHAGENPASTQAPDIDVGLAWARALHYALRHLVSVPDIGSQQPRVWSQVAVGGFFIAPPSRAPHLQRRLWICQHGYCDIAIFHDLQD